MVPERGMTMDIYETLARIAAEKAPLGYLAGYANDLHKHDKATLESATLGQQYVWLLRECGTQLFPVAGGLNPVWLTYWLEHYAPNIPPLAYLVTVRGHNSTVRPITHEAAERFAREPHPEGKRIEFSLLGERVVTA
jgi:hypothetical protein